MLVGVYPDKGRVSDTPESAETFISENPYRHFPKYKQTIEYQIIKLTIELLIHTQWLLAADRKNTSRLRKFSPGLKPMFCIELFILPLYWADLSRAQQIYLPYYDNTHFLQITPNNT